MFHNAGLPILDYYGAWKKACAAAKLPGKLVHDFRRTAVRNLERAGVEKLARLHEMLAEAKIG